MISNSIPTDIPIVDDFMIGGLSFEMNSCDYKWKHGDIIIRCLCLFLHLDEWLTFSCLKSLFFPLIFSEYFSLMFFTFWGSLLFILEIKILVFFSDFQWKKKREKNKKMKIISKIRRHLKKIGEISLKCRGYATKQRECNKRIELYFSLIHLFCKFCIMEMWRWEINQNIGFVKK